VGDIRSRDLLAYAPIGRQVTALEDIVRSNPVICRLLDTLPAMQLPSWYVGAGAVAQTVVESSARLPAKPRSQGL
jgi:hypothetical protein